MTALFVAFGVAMLVGAPAAVVYAFRSAAQVDDAMGGDQP